MTDERTSHAWRAIATLYNALATAMVVSLVARRGADTAREYVLRFFRRQHLAKFLPGLAKLGLDREPHAVACALYHYHSNALGGVKTEYFRESGRKAWVRYPPPRWMWRGSAIAAIPHEVSAAMLHGWHGHNGVSLGNPRLGFVCTGMTVDGMPGLEGYYLEHDRTLAESERVRFAYGEETMPRFDPALAPKLDAAAWPEERLARARRGYAMDYVRTMLATLEDLLGAEQAAQELGRVARLIGLQFYEETAGGGDFLAWLESMLAGQGERVVRQRDALQIDGWSLGQGLELSDATRIFLAWNELWVGASLAHDRFWKLVTEVHSKEGRVVARWAAGVGSSSR
jgi:hypothetical protein